MFLETTTIQRTTAEITTGSTYHGNDVTSLNPPGIEITTMFHYSK